MTDIRKWCLHVPSLNLFANSLVVGPRSGRRHVPFDEPKSARLKGGSRWSAGLVDKLDIWKACRTIPTPQSILFVRMIGIMIA